MQPAYKIIVNTGIIYGKAVVTVVLSLYTTRLTLNILGAEDFGLFNVIAGVVIMLSFLNTAMVTSTQRNISFSLGTGTLKLVKKVFANSMILHIIIGLLLIIIFESFGLYFLNNQMKIEPDRLPTANILFQFVIISTFMTVISVPYDALVNAHENMLFVAITGTLDVVFKFLIAIFLYYTTSDKLMAYGFLLLISSIIIVLIKRIYVKRKYHNESKVSLRKEYDKKEIKNLVSFAGWNTFGALCGMARSQGLSIIFNIFLGTVINAAYAIANQLAGQMTFFSATILQVMNPQIMKSEGANDRKRMLRLSMFASKMCYFLLAFLAIPFFFESRAILSLWLKAIPEYTLVFCNLLVLSILINQFTIGLQSAIQATGHVKRYQSIVGSLLLLNLPIAYLLLKIGYSPYWTLIVYSVIELLACIIRIYMLKLTAGLVIRDYINRVFMKELVPTIMIIITCLLIVNCFSFTYRFLLTGVASSVVFFIMIYYTGLCEDEKVKLVELFRKIKYRISL